MTALSIRRDRTPEVLRKLAKVETDVEILKLASEMVVEAADAVEMIFDLEEKFDIQIPYNANTNNPRTEFETVGDVVQAVQKLVDEKKS